MNDSHETRLLNVDFDIRASTGLGDLLRALGSSVVILNNDDPTFASVEIGTMDPQTIDEAALLYYHAIQSLPDAAKEIWVKAEARSFNIGIQAGRLPHSAAFPVSARTLSLLEDLNAEIVLTVYSPPTDELTSGDQMSTMSSSRQRTSEAAE
jgi:hypothetical protein